MNAERPGVVSVWAGRLGRRTFESFLEERFEGLGRMAARFTGDLGELYWERELLEAAWHPMPKPFAALLRGHSWWGVFSEAAAAAARKDGVAEANGIVLLYDREFNGSWPASARLRWLGTFEYRR